jgi:hypothetical protein
MNLMDVLKATNGGQNIETFANQFGISGDQAQSVLGQLLPALAQGAQQNSGLEGLLGALSSGRHSQYIDDPTTLSQPETIADGNGILGHLLGSKDASRALASHVAGNTGLSDVLIKQMLPVVASLAMGAMSKQTQTSASPLEGIAGMLDFDKDGSAVDDVMGLMGKFFGR